MAKRKTPQAKALQIEISDPDSLPAYLSRYLDWMAVHHFAPSTCSGRKHTLGVFLCWCQQRGLEQPQEITRPIAESYQRYIYRLRKKDGSPFGILGQTNYLTALKSFFKWLSQGRYILYNPCSELELPRQQKRLPRDILTAEEVEKVMAVPDVNDSFGLRDRAMLEVLYSTGIRRNELVHLKQQDWDGARGTLTVRLGKGGRDRMLPIGERALFWIQHYLDRSRPDLLTGFDDGTLFLNNAGKALDPTGLSRRIGLMIKGANIGKEGSCHLFRHTLATLMLENGADIRHIQEMLGHASLKTTQIYTQVSIRNLKEVHSQTHPGANLTAKQRERIARDGKSNNDVENAKDALLLDDDEMDCFDE